MRPQREPGKRSDSSEGDSGDTRRERRPEIPPSAPPARDDEGADDAGVVQEIVKDDQEDG